MRREMGIRKREAARYQKILKKVCDAVKEGQIKRKNLCLKKPGG
jgi:hypothetical protein